MAIKFGTSGWRGIIADDFTFANLEIAAHAIAQFLRENPPAGANPLLIAGHDTRFLGREFTDRAAKIIARYGFEVLLCNGDTPTPVISFQIRAKKAAGGINITASHNPPQWSGLKFNQSDGGPAVPENTKKIEQIATEISEGKRKIVTENRGKVAIFDPRPDYIRQIRSLIDEKILKKSPKRVAVDLMFGTGRGYLDAILQDCGWKVDALHGAPDPLFGNGHPEPIAENLGELLAALRKSRAALGLGLDPDADRFAVVDGNGEFINANQILVLTLYHLVKNRKWTGAVVRTVATTHLVDAVAKYFGLKVHETPVGFKYIGALMEREPIIVGGEESGGLSVKGHVPEKDGILACLLMAELIASEGKSLGEILSEIYKFAGQILTDRVNLRIPAEKKSALLEKLAAGFDVMAGKQVKDFVTKDGYKFVLDDGSWVMFRASGTEPVIRIYLEAFAPRELDLLRKAALDIVGR
jgi:phosphoglucomutase